VQNILELDSGSNSDFLTQESLAVRRIDEESLREVERRMAVVVLTKNEKLEVFKGVLTGIPHNCLVIVVSNSQRRRIDRFKMEWESVHCHYHFSDREALVVHQKDPKFARALLEANYSELLGDDGLVRDGKSEGMVMGLLLAMSLGKDYVGFIDADNYIPGSVLEYVRNYAAGFSMTTSPYAMVRMLWGRKRRVPGDAYFRKWGTVSKLCNQCIDSLISVKVGFETEIVKTACAGEHAMSIRLAELLPYASGFAVEPYEMIAILEQFGDMLPLPPAEIVEHGVEIFQIETRNPHIHEERAEHHLTKEILLPCFSAIYHSPLCETSTKQMIMDVLVSHKCLQPWEEPPSPMIMPPPRKMNKQKFAAFIQEHFGEYAVGKSSGYVAKSLAKASSL